MSETTKEPVSFRLDKDLKQNLAELAAETGRSQTFLASEAIRQYYDLQKWQIEAIKEGIREADAGNFIPHEEIKRKWEKKLADHLGAKG